MKKLSLLVFMGAVVVGIAGAAPFVDGDRVALWGDSITHAGLYPKMLADFYLTRYPDRTVRFYNAGVAGDNAGAAMSRFEEDVKRWNPTVVTLMFGMNDSGRTMYDPRWMANPSYRAGIPAREKKCYDTYSANMAKLVARLRADLPKARRMFLTPTPYDETAVQKDVHLAPALKGTVATLKRYADCGKKLAAETGGEVVDWNTAYQDLVVREQRKNPAFSFVRPDRVHPAAPGHLFMTSVFLKTQGVSGIVSDVALSAKSGTVQKSDNATVSDFTKTADGCAFTLLERALPWPIESAAKPALALAPILEDLNREVVAVKDLVPGARYTLFIDGTDVGTWTADELALGVNLANNAKTPQARQAAEVERKNAARCAIECDQLRMFAASRWYLRLRKVNPDDFAAVKAHYDGLKYKNGYFECKLPAYLRDYAKREAIERDQDTRWAELLALRTPKAHRYEVKRVAAESPAHVRAVSAAEEVPTWRILGDGTAAYAAPMVEHPGMVLAAQQMLDRTYSRGCLRLTADIRTPAKWTGSPGHGTSLRVGLAPAARTALVAARQTIGEFGPDFQKSGRTTKAFALTRDEAGRAAGRVMEVARAEAWYRYTVTFDLEKQTYSGTVCDRESGASAGSFEGAKFCRAFDPKSHRRRCHPCEGTLHGLRFRVSCGRCGRRRQPETRMAGTGRDGIQDGVHLRLCRAHRCADGSTARRTHGRTRAED